MSLPVWPESLPQYPLIDGYSEVPQDSVLRVDMDGLTKQRNRFTATIFNVEESYLLTKDQFATFKNFYFNTLRNGSREFLKISATEDIQRVFRFAAVYDMDFNGVQYKVSISLERLP